MHEEILQFPKLVTNKADVADLVQEGILYCLWTDITPIYIFSTVFPVDILNILSANGLFLVFSS